jgi:hypothetical protein
MYPEKIIGAILQLNSQGCSIRAIIKVLRTTWKFTATTKGVWGAI